MLFGQLYEELINVIDDSKVQNNYLKQLIFKVIDRICLKPSLYNGSVKHQGREIVLSAKRELIKKRQQLIDTAMGDAINHCTDTEVRHIRFFVISWILT